MFLGIEDILEYKRESLAFLFFATVFSISYAIILKNFTYNFLINIGCTVFTFKLISYMICEIIFLEAVPYKIKCKIKTFLKITTVLFISLGTLLFAVIPNSVIGVRYFPIFCFVGVSYIILRKKILTFRYHVFYIDTDPYGKTIRNTMFFDNEEKVKDEDKKLEILISEKLHELSQTAQLDYWFKETVIK